MREAVRFFAVVFFAGAFFFAAERARRLFQGIYDAAPTVVVRAPGRVNLIGDHTDYNAGFVLPMAIDADLVIAARPRVDGRVHAVSESQPDPAEFIEVWNCRDVEREHLPRNEQALDP